MMVVLYRKVKSVWIGAGTPAGMVMAYFSPSDPPCTKTAGHSAFYIVKICRIP
jgi:hypothetical protein